MRLLATALVAFCSLRWAAALPDLAVMKFGGSSLATGTKVFNVAEVIQKQLKRPGSLHPVVVCSAMGKTTDEIRAIWNAIQNREMATIKRKQTIEEKWTQLRGRRSRASSAEDEMGLDAIQRQETYQATTEESVVENVPAYIGLFEQLRVKHRKIFDEALVHLQLADDKDAQHWWTTIMDGLFMGNFRKTLDTAFEATSSVGNNSHQRLSSPKGKPAREVTSDEVVSFGERISVRIVYYILKRLLGKESVKHPVTASYSATGDSYVAEAFDSWDLGLSTTSGCGGLDSAHSSCTVKESSLTTDIPEQFEKKWMEKFSEKSRRLIAVITGYIAKDASKRITTLGRDGSDYSATLFGAALNAKAVQVYKEDVGGVMSCDPGALMKPDEYRQEMALRKKPAIDTFLTKEEREAEGITGPLTSGLLRVDNPNENDPKLRVRPIPFLSYEQAAELATFGASVIHPRAMEPIKKLKIPLEVRSTQEPYAVAYTVIGALEDREMLLKKMRGEIAGGGKTPVSTGLVVQSRASTEEPRRPLRPRAGSSPTVIALTQNKRPSLLKISSPNMVNTPGYMSTIFDILKQNAVSVDVTVTSTTSVSITTDGDPVSVENLKTATEQLKAALNGDDDERVATVTVDNTASTLTLLTRAEDDGSVRGDDEFKAGTTQRVMSEAMKWLTENGVDVKLVTKESDLQVTFVIDDSRGQLKWAMDGLHRKFVEGTESEL